MMEWKFINSVDERAKQNIYESAFWLISNSFIILDGFYKYQARLPLTIERYDAYACN